MHKHSLHWLWHANMRYIPHWHLHSYVIFNGDCLFVLSWKPNDIQWPAAHTPPAGWDGPAGRKVTHTSSGSGALAFFNGYGVLFFVKWVFISKAPSSMKLVTCSSKQPEARAQKRPSRFSVGHEQSPRCSCPDARSSLFPQVYFSLLFTLYFSFKLIGYDYFSITIIVIYT